MANSNFRNRFSEPERVVTPGGGELMTQQSFKDEVNINTIVNRFIKTGVMGSGTGTRKPIFGDFTSHDYMAMQNTIADIGQQFDSLPARLRKRFDNDPRQLIRFVEDPANLAESVKLGLVVLPDGFELVGGKLVQQQDLVAPKEPVASDPTQSDPEANPGKKAVKPV